MRGKSVCLIMFMMAVVTASAYADKLSGLSDVTVVDNAIVSIRYGGIEYVVAEGDLALGTTTRWYIDAGVEVLWPEGDPVPAAAPTVAGTSNPKNGDVGSKADNFLFRLDGSDNISSIDGIDFQETVFPFLAKTFFLFERGGNDTGTWQAILADGSLGAPLAFSAATAYADTGVAVGAQNAYGVVFTTDVPVQGVRITASGHDTLSISTPAPIPVLASIPSPPDKAEDVPRDTILGWKPGQSAKTHDVYLGTVFDDVSNASRTNPLGVLVSQSQDSNTYDPDGLLEFSQTYYWRIDEVDAPPNSTIFKGDVWSFTIESFAYPIESITATASSSATGQGPENTVNGSGLDDSGELHGKESDGTMWLSDLTGVQPSWIEYEFDRVYKLHEMWVWNYNESWELMIGVGFRDVTIEYSVNGTDYTTLGTTHEFAQGQGIPDYAHNTTVDFGGAAAKYVRLTANSNWGGGILNQYGISEVRFFYIPVNAREPYPDSGAPDVDVDIILGWRAGREAAEHNVYLSTDEQTVIDGTAPVNTVTEANYGPLSLNLGSTYYWRVDEVNNADAISTWQGDIWRLSTQEYLVVDDFEDYNEFEPFTVYNTWTDGYQDTTNGSTIGYVLGNPQETKTVHGGKQSVPVMYDNSVASFSEVTVNTDDLAIGRDWTKGGAGKLVLWFYGDPANAATERLYVKLNSAKVLYDGDALDITKPGWKQWDIELSGFGVVLSNVTQLSIGFERTGISGGSGTVFIDDIRLYGAILRQPVITISPVDTLEATGDNGMIISINGISVNDMILGTTTFAGEPKSANFPPQDADNFDLSLGASADDQAYVQTMFAVPVTTIFIIEKGGNDTGYMQSLDKNGDPIGEPVPFTPADFKDTGLKGVQGQAVAAAVITVDMPIYGIRILPPDDKALGFDPTSVSGIAAQ